MFRRFDEANAFMLVWFLVLALLGVLFALSPASAPRDAELAMPTVHKGGLQIGSDAPEVWEVTIDGRKYLIFENHHGLAVVPKS